MRRILSPLFLVSCITACGGRVDGTPPGGVGADAGLGNPGNSNDPGDAAPGGGSSTGAFRDIFLPVWGVDLALDDGAIYVFDDMGQVTRIDKASGTTRALVAQPALGAHLAVTVCGDRVFWADTGANNGCILSVPKSGGELEVFKTGLHAPSGIACDATNFYWAEQGTADSNIFDGVIASAPLAGGDRVVLTDHEGWATNTLALTDDAVIFASNLASGAEIRRVAKTGGAVTTLSTAPGAMFDIQIAGDYVLWTASTGAFWAPVAGGPVTQVGDWPTANLTFTGEHFVYEDGDPSSPYARRIESAPPGGVATVLGRATHVGSHQAAVSDASGAYLMDVQPGYGTTIHVVGR